MFDVPSLAIVHAINLPPALLPSTRTSYLSGSLVALIPFGLWRSPDRISTGTPAVRVVVLIAFMREGV